MFLISYAKSIESLPVLDAGLQQGYIDKGYDASSFPTPMQKFTADATVLSREVIFYTVRCEKYGNMDSMVPPACNACNRVILQKE